MKGEDSVRGAAVVGRLTTTVVGRGEDEEG